MGDDLAKAERWAHKHAETELAFRAGGRSLMLLLAEYGRRGEALAVLRELVAMDEYRVWIPEEIYIRASAVLAGAAPAGDVEPVETREEWGVAYGEEVDPGWRYVDRKTAETWMEHARPAPHMNARLFRRTVTTSPWVAVPDPAESEEKDRG